jgi:hypothetical protein
MGPCVRRDDEGVFAHLNSERRKDVTPHSRGMMCPRFAKTSALTTRRGRREDRVRAAPAVSCARCTKTRTRAYRFSGNTPAFPAQWFYGLYRALPGDRAFLPPSLADHSTSLTPASGRQNHTTSPSTIGSVRLTQLSRPPHPTARFVTCATPLSSGETGELVALICPTP